MNLRTFKKNILNLIYNEKKLSSNYAKRQEAKKKKINSKLLKLHEYGKSISVSTQLS